MTFNVPVESSSSVKHIDIEYLHEYQRPIHQPKAKVEKIFDGLGDAIEEENTAFVLEYVFEEFTVCYFISPLSQQIWAETPPCKPQKSLTMHVARTGE